MPKRATNRLSWHPRNQSYVLEAHGAPLGISVSTMAWFEWLDDTTSFAFHSRSGDIATVCKEAVQRGGAYWYAYRRVRGRMSKRYLGRGGDLTVDRLETIAASLSEAVLPRQLSPSSSETRTAALLVTPATLLLTKLQAPPISKRLVPRPHILQRLQRGMTRPLTLVTAPAGFGKSTALRLWLQEVRQPIAWVSLDVGDDDPVLFWTYLLTALDTHYPGVADTAFAMLTAPHPPALETMLHVLMNAIAMRDEEIVLVLDDYHVMTSPAIHASLALLLEHPLARFHLYIASREEPSLPLARLHARDQINEICTDDLRFRPDEATIFLSDVIGVALSSDDITTLTERADGWIAGLQLAGLSLQGHVDPSRFIATFSGSHRHIMRYLGEEVLAAQPPEIQAFLLKTAVLERLCAPLCDALTGRHDSHLMLERLQQANLFLTPLDDEGCWYRYHHLFADLLRHRLREQQGDQLAELHRRAAHWLELEGWINEAVDHLLQVPDVDEAACLIEQAARPLLLRGDVAPLVHLLGRVPEEGMLARPFLCLIHVRVLFYRGDLATAASRLATAERFLTPLPDGTFALDADQRRKLTAYLAVVKATLPAMRGDADATIAQVHAAQRLLATVDRDPFYNSDTLNVPLGLAYVMKSALSAAESAFAAASQGALADGNLVHAALALMLRAGVLSQQGRLRDAEMVLQYIIHLLETEASAPRALACSVYIDLASLLYERNDLVAAKILTEKIIALGKEWANDDDLVSGYLQLAKFYQAQGQPAAAWEEVQRVERLLQKMAQSNVLLPWTPTYMSASIARLAIRQGQLHLAEQWAYVNGFRDDALVSRPQQPQQEFTDATFARLLLAQGRLDLAADFLDGLLPVMQSAGRNGSVIELALLRALVWQARGEIAPALVSLQQALTLAAPEGYMRIFLDEGIALRELLLRVRDGQPKGSLIAHYCDTLVASFHRRSSPSGHQSLVPLTRREREVLRLLAEGHSNEAIAQQLVVALSTIKTHLHHLFAKLQTSDRLQTVIRARELGLIDV